MLKKQTALQRMIAVLKGFDVMPSKFVQVKL
jgi:hypothetical protein